MKTGHEELMAVMKAGHEELMAIMETDQEEIMAKLDAHHERMMAKVGSHLENGGLSRNDGHNGFEANPQEVKSIAVHEEVTKVEAAVETLEH
jgi:hypothetical protein